MRGRNGGWARGFTLLELMVAISILALALTWLVEATTRAIEAENHSKLVTTGTFLARQVLVDLETDLVDKGIQDDAFASEKNGTFEETGFKRFTWRRIVDKITLPGTDTVQSAMGKATGAGGGGLGGFADSSGGGGSPLGALGGIPGMSGAAGNSTPGSAASTNMFSNQFGLVKEILEQAIRKATVRVVWTEHGVEQSVEVSEYLTDPRKVDLATGGMGNMLNALPPGLGGGGGGGGGNKPPPTPNPRQFP